VLEREAEETARAIGRGAFAHRLDVTSREPIDGMVRRVAAEAGWVDVLVDGAAIYDMGPLLEIEEPSYDTQFAINVKGLLFTPQAVARRVVEQGRGGKIINISIQAGRRGTAASG
jgi:NAD(P)-dependent dehydrogenase (short-subunit alcohol dehydrogenase family)